MKRIMKRRLTKDEMFMEQARVYAKRSACLQFQVGIVFVKDDVVITGGYNGPPRGEPNCCEVGCAKLDKTGKRLPAGSGQCRGAHAEMNAIVNAAAREGGLKNSRVYCAMSSCYDCAKHLVGLPITEFVYEKKYDEKEGNKAIALLKRRKVKVRQFKLGRR
ncbi:MAG: dCMP deaminase family protein [Patescibacteria group bacterium]